MFTRLRAMGAWIFNSTVDPDEWEAFDENLSNAIDGADGGTYGPTDPIVIAGSGLRTTVQPTNADQVVTRATKEWTVSWVVPGAFNASDYASKATWVEFTIIPGGGGGGHGASGLAGTGGGGSSGFPKVARFRLADLDDGMVITPGSPGNGGIAATSTAATNGQQSSIAGTNFSIIALGGLLGGSTSGDDGGDGAAGYLGGGGGSGVGAVNGGDGGHAMGTLTQGVGANGSGTVGGESAMKNLATAMASFSGYFPPPFVSCAAGVGGTATSGFSGGGGGAAGFLDPGLTTVRFHVAQGQTGWGYGAGGGGGSSGAFSGTARNGLNGTQGIIIARIW